MIYWKHRPQAAWIAGLVLILALQVTSTYGQENDPLAGGDEATLIPESATPEGEKVTVDQIRDVPCIPSCRTGFMCHQGVCISLCNPPCSERQQCTEARKCVTVPGDIPSPAAGPAVVAAAPHTAGSAQAGPRMSRSLEKQQRREQRMAARQLNRKKLRLAVAVVGAYDQYGEDASIGVLSAGLQFGAKKYLANVVAIQGHGSFLAGGTLDGPRASVLSPRGNIAFLFVPFWRIPVGPFWRFYLGPSFWLQGGIIQSNYDYPDATGEIHHFKNEILAGMGGEAGMMLGKDERIDLFMRFKITREFEQEPYFETGIGFHFLPQE